MSATMSNPFRGRPVAGGGEGVGTREVPSADTHEARCVALIDLGTHAEAFGNEEPKPKRKVYLVWELDEKMSASTYNHVIGQELTLSFHEKAGLRLLAEALLNGGARFAADADIDYSKLLGAAAMVTITHQTNGDRTFARLAKGGIGPVPKNRRDKVFKPTRQPLAWSVGQGDPAELPDWLPWYFGRPLAEKIRESREMSADAAPADNGEGEVAAEDDTPF